VGIGEGQHPVITHLRDRVLDVVLVQLHVHAGPIGDEALGDEDLGDTGGPALAAHGEP